MRLTKQKAQKERAFYSGSPFSSFSLSVSLICCSASRASLQLAGMATCTPAPACARIAYSIFLLRLGLNTMQMVQVRSLSMLLCWAALTSLWAFE